MFRRKKKNDDDYFDDYAYDYYNYSEGNSVSRSRFPTSAFASSLVALALASLIYFLIIAPSLNKAEGVADTLAKGINVTFGFTPAITINEKVYITETKPILELAVLQKSLDVNYEYKKKVFGLNSKLELEGKYVVKAGFDLQDESVT